MPRIRVGWLSYGVERPLSGVTRYALELGRALGQRSDVEVVYLTAYRVGPFVREAGVQSAPLLGCSRLPALMTLGGLAILIAARRRRLDVVHDPLGIAPFPFPQRLAPFKRVVTIHDAIGFRYPQGYPWLNNVLQRRYLPAMLPNVDAVITVSRHARAEIARFLPGVPPRSYIAPPAISRDFRPIPEAVRRPVLERLGLHAPYVLSVSAQQERKNVRGLIDAFARVHAARPDVQLALAGPTLWRYPSFSEQIARSGLKECVISLGYVADADLPALYSGAAAFALPSLYEGFGIPILEAMACGAPVVCSNTTALPETAANAALLVDPTSAESIADGLLRVLGDEALAADLRRRGRERAQIATWQASAAATVAAYRDVFAGVT